MGELIRLHKLNNGRYSMTKTGTPTNLVCDEKTRIVYYKFTEKFTDGLRIEKSFLVRIIVKMENCAVLSTENLLKLVNPIPLD